MTKIVGLSGSLRSASWNTALLRAAAKRMPEKAELVIGTINGIPLYDQDVEDASGIPGDVELLKDMIAEADGLVIATPEYNNSIPGVLKNAIDWLSRPTSDISRVFEGKPVALIGATPGGLGTALAQDAWLPILRRLGTRPWFGGRLLVSGATRIFDDEGAIADEVIGEQLREFMVGFVAFARENAS